MYIKDRLNEVCKNKQGPESFDLEHISNLSQAEMTGLANRYLEDISWCHINDLI